MLSDPIRLGVVGTGQLWDTRGNQNGMDPEHWGSLRPEGLTDSGSVNFGFQGLVPCLRG